MYRSRLLVLASIVALVCLATAVQAVASEESDAKEILQVAAVRCGLCVHLGAGSATSPGLAAALAAESKLLVHAVAADDAAVERARKAVEAKGVLGRAMVEKLAMDPLPHLRDLANLVVIEDLDALAARGLKLEEVQRITQPGGAICVKTGSRWSKSIKPRPAGMDEWTHPNHGPDGNMVSADRLVRFPVGLRWQDGMPMNFNLWSACRGWVVAGGRCFTLSTTELENLGPASIAKHEKHEYLTARDAFNGLPLWKVNCGTTNEGQALNAWSVSPLATDGSRVYAYQGDRLAAFDAATGQVAATYAVKYPSAWLLLTGNTIVSAGWEAKEEAKDSGKPPLWSFYVSKTPKGAVEAFDVRRGTPAWSIPSPAAQILAGDGLIYALLQSGNPAKEQQIVAVDARTGRQQWRVPHQKLATDPTLHLCNAGPGVLIVARVKAKAVSVLSAADGSQLWEIPKTESFFTPVVDGLVWHGNRKYDPKTGQARGTLPAGVHSALCTPAAIVGNILTASRGGDYVQMLFTSDAQPKGANRIHYGALRGACIEGTTPAYGMFYTGQNFCRCTPGQVPGFVAFGPNGELPTAADFEQPRPMEKGPASGPLASGDAAADWPMYRHDNQRSASTDVRAPEKLAVLWQADAAKPADGPLAPAWNARLAACVSPPVVAAGKVFVAAVDAGQLVALEAASGKPACGTSVGSRLDTPPTVFRGLCLFGAHDGWIYALRAADGQLAWRTRAAPWERRMVAFGQVESVWPALGSVLVHDGLLYATAGRTCESDGGVAVCALEPQSGNTVWARAIGPGPARQNDVLALRDGKLSMFHVQIDPKTGKHELGKAHPQVGLEGFIDGSWTRLGNRRSGNLAFGRLTAEMLAWSDAMVYGYQGPARTCFAIARDKTAIGKLEPKDYKFDPKDYTWRVSLPTNHQAEAMVLCPNALVMAGRVFDPKTQAVSGFLWTVSPTDGKRLSEQKLDAPPAYDGLAVAHGRIYLADQNGRVTCFGDPTGN